MTKQVKFITGKAPTFNTKLMLFDVPVCADLTKKNFLNMFFFEGKHEVTRINFYNEDGVVYSLRWFERRHSSGNVFDNVMFANGIANRRVIRFDRDEVFRVSSESRSTWSDGYKSIDVYVPMSALDAYGWAEVETTEEHDYTTVIERYVYVGGECTEKDHMFRIPVSTKRTEHWDKKKEDLLKELSVVMTEKEFKEVLHKFSIYTK